MSKRLSALAQLIALYAEKGVTKTGQLVELTGYTDRAIRKARAELGCRNQGADRNQGAEKPEPGDRVSSPPPPKRKVSPCTPSKENTPSPPEERLLLDKSSESARQEIRDFEAWYAAYPRHVGRGQALRAYRAARRKAPAERLLSGAQQARERYSGTEQHFIPHPSTWLNGERWLDEWKPSVVPSGGSHDGWWHEFLRTGKVPPGVRGVTA